MFAIKGDLGIFAIKMNQKSTKKSLPSKCEREHRTPTQQLNCKIIMKKFGKR
jgi:hypothetical protein